MKTAPTGSRTRVFIVSDQTIHREGLCGVLAGGPLRVVGSAATCADAITALASSRPDVILLALPSLTAPAAHALRTLTAACAPAHVLVLAAALTKSQIADALKDGVRGVALENVTGATLVKSLRAVAAGRYWLAPECLLELVQAPPAPDHAGVNGSAVARLTPRELEIISLVSAGDANRNIAVACGISEKTVKHHLTNIFDKLGVSSRLELAVFALEHRIVDAARRRS